MVAAAIFGWYAACASPWHACYLYTLFIISVA